jgi:outer membrane protein assembly factor BamB
LSVSILTFTCAVFAAHAENWPRFRGPNGEGISNDKHVPIQWTETDGIAWRAAIPGTGNSSPIVWGDRIFVQSATEKERMLLCMSAHDGKMLWTQTVAGSKGKINPKNSLASSTPATDGKRIYALFWDGQDIVLHAFGMDGKPLWQHNLGSFTSQHGPGMSPMVVGERVILINDQDVSSVLIALNAKDGKTAWEAPRKHFRACYSTPFLLEKVGADPQLIVGSTAGLTSYEPTSGKENWSWTWKFDGMALRTVASPVQSQGIIILSSGDGSGARQTIAVKADKKPSLVWQVKRDFPYVPCLLISGDLLFSVTDGKEGGIAMCHALKTGKLIWRERLDCGDVSASPVLIDGKIYVCGEQGDVIVYEAAPKFKLLAKNTMGEAVFATPAVAEDRLYIRGAQHLFCIAKAAGK